MSVRQCVAIILLSLAAAAPASARMLYFRMDPVHSQVLVSVDHDGYSHPVGRMKIKAGWIGFDEDDWSTAKVVADVDAASVDFGDTDWNDAVTGKRCTFAFFPWNWDRGDGCIIRLVAIIDPNGKYRIENGAKFK